MNYLAHLFLADGGDDDFVVGNVLADFVRGRIPDELREGVKRGVRHHRRLDAFTDDHQAILHSKRLVARSYGHVAPVIVDLFIDHLLALKWAHYSSEPFEHFTKRNYRTLASFEDQRWPRYSVMVERMAAFDWLGSYRHRSGISEALAGIARRLSRPVDLSSAVELLDAQRDDFERDFERFFADVVEESERIAAP